MNLHQTQIKSQAIKVRDAGRKAKTHRTDSAKRIFEQVQNGLSDVRFVLELEGAQLSSNASDGTDFIRVATLNSRDCFCNCPDHRFGQNTCKHMQALAALVIVNLSTKKVKITADVEVVENKPIEKAESKPAEKPQRKLVSIGKPPHKVYIPENVKIAQASSLEAQEPQKEKILDTIYKPCGEKYQNEVGLRAQKAYGNFPTTGFMNEFLLKSLYAAYGPEILTAVLRTVRYDLQELYTHKVLFLRKSNRDLLGEKIMELESIEAAIVESLRVCELDS